MREQKMLKLKMNICGDPGDIAKVTTHEEVICKDLNEANRVLTVYGFPIFREDEVAKLEPGVRVIGFSFTNCGSAKLELA